MRRRVGRPCPRLLFDAAENQALRRWTHGPPALASPPDLIYFYRWSRRSQVARGQGRPPRRRLAHWR